MPTKARLLSLRFRAFYLKYFLRFLGLAGFGMLISCTKYGAPIAEYGVIVDDYVNFHGQVLSEDSLKPIKNIKVKLTFQPNDTLNTLTDPSGNYSIHQHTVQGQTGTLIFSDIDGNLNGNFYEKDTNFAVSINDLNNLEHLTNINLERKP